MYEIFEKLLLEKGIRTADVVRATGISQSTFTDWKKGRYSPKLDKLQKIADYFGVPVSAFSEVHNASEDYYMNGEATKLAQFLAENPGHKALFDASRKVKAEDLKKALAALNIFVEE